MIWQAVEQPALPAPRNASSVCLCPGSPCPPRSMQLTKCDEGSHPLALMSADMHDGPHVCCCAGAFSSGAGQQGGAVPGSNKPRFADSKGLGKSMSKALAQADAGEGPLSAHCSNLVHRLPAVRDEVRWSEQGGTVRSSAAALQSGLRCPLVPTHLARQAPLLRQSPRQVRHADPQALHAASVKRMSGSCAL